MKSRKRLRSIMVRAPVAIAVVVTPPTASSRSNNLHSGYIT
jgi:hypothetical protein